MTIKTLLFASTAFLITLPYVTFGDANTAGFEISLIPKLEEILPKMPLIADLVVENATEKDLAYRPRPLRIEIRRDGSDLGVFTVLDPTHEETDLGVVPVLLKPGTPHVSAVWLVMGKRDGSPSWVFLFEEKGKYMIRPLQQKRWIRFEVRSFDNLDMLSLISKDIGFALSRGRMSPRTKSSIEDFVKRHPTCDYAPYLRVRLAEEIWTHRAGRLPQKEEYHGILLPIVEGNEKEPVWDHAMYLLAQSLAFRENSKQELYEVRERLHKFRPNSTFASRVKQEFAPWPKPITPSPRRPTVPKIDTHAPNEVDESLKEHWARYLRNLYGGRDHEKFSSLLDSGYASQLGARSDRIRVWRQQSAGASTKSIDAVMISAKLAESYTHKPIKKTWKGEIQEVTYRLKLDLGGGRNHEVTAVVVFVRHDNNDWKVLTEFSIPTRNAIAGALIQQLLQQPRAKEGNIKVTKRDKTRVQLITEIRKSLDKQSAIGVRFVSMEMAGSSLDEPVVNWSLTFADGTHETVQTQFTVEDGVLVLADIREI